MSQQSHEDRALDQLSLPTLRPFKAQQLLAALEGDFRAPTHGIPREILFGLRICEQRPDSGSWANLVKRGV